MSSSLLARVARASRFSTQSCRVRPMRSSFQVSSFKPTTSTNTFSTATRKLADHDAHDPHHEESFEEFTARYEKEFESVQDVFELQRNLNNAFAYDLVPSPSVITAALRAARRVNDYPTAVRIFEGIKAKVENKGQYEEYVQELKGIREELGINLKDDMYPEQA
ncbi:Putative cytochrome c oxidase, subunit Va/VI [Septoria linicola]|uniref:Cytochrome c oxidase subunit 6, mitochondrial n=1 Tax=Septoria linicola TaxID=215465 RepID=A0A9Q9EJ43_9PEZI|nr:putative cytochrome c oxidase, subunit Va/VI [Septoria linicola]USW51752.1 Putative cytochrome c oxidase, subunit Va/VI [Septoria linicola]